MSIASGQWIRAFTAAKRLGITVYRFHKMAIAGRVRTRIEPGQNPVYNADDVDRLVAEREQPATVAAS
jgi:predicted site-specific integrase-resolvase